MKKTLLLILLAIAAMAYQNQASAQVSVSVNISSQPVWGPTGYDYARYYYFPDIDAYYAITNKTFVYLQGGKWVFGASLPASFNFDLYNGYKVVVNDAKPYLHPDVYRAKYAQYKGQHTKQEVIRDSRDTKYAVVPGHALYKKAPVKEPKRDEAHGRH